MRRDGGVEGLILEKVNGLPLDKRCVPVGTKPEVNRNFCSDYACVL